jgi:hypothetical protein
MRIGNRESVLDPRIPNLGFTFVDEMNILGFEIDAKIENLERNFDKCITKMRKTIGLGFAYLCREGSPLLNHWYCRR